MFFGFNSTMLNLQSDIITNRRKLTTKQEVIKQQLRVGRGGIDGGQED